MDFYKAKNILDGEDVFIHLYVREDDQKVGPVAILSGYTSEGG
jgi:hypothetical protein